MSYRTYALTPPRLRNHHIISITVIFVLLFFFTFFILFTFLILIV